MSENEKRACLEQLDSFIREINALLALIGDRQTLFGAERDQAREMFTALKSRLRSEYRRTSTVRGQASLNAVERAYYAPAVHEASCELQVKTNSLPGTQWCSNLYGARIDLEFLATQLRDQLDSRTAGVEPS